MTPLALLLLLAAEHRLPATDVWLAGHGPFRFVVDTGAESSAAVPEVARDAGLQPAYRVEVATASGTLLAPATAGAPVSVPGKDPAPVELMWHSLAAIRQGDPGARGVLGMNFLRNHAVLLDLRAGTAHFDLAPAGPGVELPFTWASGRLAVEAQVDGGTRRLVLDTGASHVVLFGHPDPAAAGAGFGDLLTSHRGGQAVATTELGILRVGGAAWRRLTAAWLPAGRGGREEDGLLPASLFEWIYFDGPRGRLMVQPRRS